jgi:hypothetical protein
MNYVACRQANSAAKNRTQALTAFIAENPYCSVGGAIGAGGAGGFATCGIPGTVIELRRSPMLP